MKQLTKQNSTTPPIADPKPSRSVRQAVPNTPLMPPSTPDAYNQFLAEASPEAQDAFYQKLAALLLKKSAI